MKGSLRNGDIFRKENLLMNGLRRFLCNILGWHRPIEKIGFDGCSMISICKHCGKRILRDSQGNWF